MLPPQIRLLDFAPSAPRPPLRRRSINHGIIIQHFILCGYDKASGTDDAVGGYSNGVVYSSTGGDGVEVAYRWRFNA